MFTAIPIVIVLWTCIKNVWGTPEPSSVFLTFYEGLARKHLRDPSFSLGPEWRKSDGSLREMRMLQTISDPVAQCGGTTSTFPADGTTVSYQMTIGTTAICLWMAADLSAIDINYNANTQSQTKQQVASGITCTECYAYIGMNFDFSMSCTYSTAACTFGFSTGGGIALNAALSLVNPTFSQSSKPANIVAPPADSANIPVSSYITLFNVDDFFLSYLPAMQVTATGTGSATGSESLSANFQTTANMEVGLNSQGQFVEGFSTAVTMQPPSLSGKGLKISDATLAVTVNATVYWSMGYTVPSVTTASINFMTPLITNYNFGVSPSGTGVACTSGESFVLDSSLTSISLSTALGSTSVPLTMPFPPVTIYSSTSGTQCLGSNGLSPGALAAAIVIPILFAIGTAGFMYYWFYVRKVDNSTTSTDPKKESTTSAATSNEKTAENLHVVNAVVVELSTVAQNPINSL